MSVIVGYYGANGAVVGGDKRNIIFRGNAEQREELEKLLYSGKIKTDEEFKKIADEYGIKVYIEDKQLKVREIEGALVGEVRSIGTDSQRRRMYLTTGNCAIIDILNDTITKKSSKAGHGLVLFGNRYLKEIVHNELKKDAPNFKDMPIEEVKNIIENAIKKCDGPTISEEIILLHTKNKHNNFKELIKKDINDLKEYRNGLRQQMIDIKKTMLIAEKIEINGEVGYIKNGVLVLDKNHLAIDTVCSNPNLYREIEIKGECEDGDIIYIDNGELKVKGKNSSVCVDKIICKA